MSTSTSPSEPPAATGPPTNASDTAARICRLQRENARLKKLTQATPKKRKSKSSTPGRAIRRCITLFDTVDSVVKEFDEQDEEHDWSPSDALAAQRKIAAYELLTEHVEGFKETLTDEAFDDVDLAEYYATLEFSANRARNDDNSRIKQLLPRWLAQLYPAMPYMDSSSRVGRGLQHDILGGLLASVSQDWDDDDVRAAIRDGEVSIGVDYFSNCLYKDCMGSIDDLDSGYLSSTLLVLTWCAIFTSPTSANGRAIDPLGDKQNVEDPALNNPKPAKKKTKLNNGAAKSRSNVANLIGLKSATPRSIAYASVLLHLNLSDASSWTSAYAGYSYSGLYNFIVDYFEAPLDDEHAEHAKQLLKWWNKQVLPACSSTPDAAASLDTSMAALVASREARQAAAAAALVAAAAAAVAAAAAAAAEPEAVAGESAT